MKIEVSIWRLEQVKDTLRQVQNYRKGKDETALDRSIKKSIENLEWVLNPPQRPTSIN